MFERSTGRRCSCAIKLINLEADGYLSIKTFARDTASSVTRSSVDQIVPQIHPNDHTPFGEIISSKSGNFGYVENDLASLAEKGKYKNANPNWRRFYNATCVVPIFRATVGPNADEPRLKVLGFICVDSLDGRFDKLFSISALRIISSALYYTFETMHQVMELYGQPYDPPVAEKSPNE